MGYRAGNQYELGDEKGGWGVRVRTLIVRILSGQNKNFFLGVGEDSKTTRLEFSESKMAVVSIQKRIFSVHITELCVNWKWRFD